MYVFLKHRLKLNPLISKDVLWFRDRILKDVIKIKCGHKNGPQSNGTDVFIVRLWSRYTHTAKDDVKILHG